MPSGQAIKLRDQQYMKKWDQFTEKWLKVVYYIFYPFAWKSFAKLLKEKKKNQVNGMTSNKKLPFTSQIDVMTILF